MTTRTTTWSLFLLAAAALVAGCGGGDDAKVSRLNVTVVGWQNADDAFPAATDDLVFRIHRGLNVLDTIEVDVRDETVTLPRLDFGEDTWISVEATTRTDSGNQTLASGATTRRFTVDEDGNTGDQRIVLAPPRQFLPAYFVDSGAGTVNVSGFELPTSARAGHTVSLRPDGTVVVIGGANMTVGASGPEFVRDIAGVAELRDTIEVYDPTRGTWLAVTIPGCDFNTLGIDGCAVRLPQAKAFHTATVLPNGDILIVGGVAPEPSLPDQLIAVGEAHILRFTGADTAELETITAIGPPITGRAFHSATLLNDSTVVIAGGISALLANPTYLSSIDTLTIEADGTATYAPATVALTTPRALHSAADFDVNQHGIIITGGRGANAALATTDLLYEEGGGLAIESGAPLSQARFAAADVTYACPIAPSTPYYAVAGGFTAVDGPSPLQGSAPSSTVDIYVPAEFQFSLNTPVTLETARAFASGTSFPVSGDMLIAGGIGPAGVVGNGESFTNWDWQVCDSFFSSSNVFRESIPMNTARALAPMVRLPSNFAYTVGGTSGSGALADGEFYNNNDFGVFQ